MTSPRRSRDGHRAIRWLWTDKSIVARMVRLALLPFSGLWMTAMELRRLAFRLGLRRVHRLGRPSVAVGNLTVGGSGKTPIAGWIANLLAGMGHRPGILLRGVGGDEILVHREAIPAAIVEADPDRAVAARRAVDRGATVLVLDDAYQRLDIARDCNICVVSAETFRAVRWPLPAGPWREGWRALDRADMVIVTRKRAGADIAARLADDIRAITAVPIAVARLEPGWLAGLVSGRQLPVSELSGRRVVAASAIADPRAFSDQIRMAGAQVQVASWPDHHPFSDDDVAWLAHAASRADHLVITAKDAVKLRHRWPDGVPEPVVAMLQIVFESGEDSLREILKDRLRLNP